MPIGGNWTVSVEFDLKDSTGSAIVDPSNLLIPPDLNDFDLPIFEIIRDYNGCTGCYGHIMGQLYTLSTVPLPATVWLFISCLIGLHSVTKLKKYK